MERDDALAEPRPSSTAAWALTALGATLGLAAGGSGVLFVLACATSALGGIAAFHLLGNGGEEPALGALAFAVAALWVLLA